MTVLNHVYLVKGHRFFYGWVDGEEYRFLAGTHESFKRYESEDGGNQGLYSVICSYVDDGFIPDVAPESYQQYSKDINNNVVIPSGEVYSVVVEGFNPEAIDIACTKLKSIFDDIDGIDLEFDESGISVIDYTEFGSFELKFIDNQIWNSYSQNEREYMIDNRICAGNTISPNGSARLKFCFEMGRMAGYALVVLDALKSSGVYISVTDGCYNFMDNKEPWTLLESCPWYNVFEDKLKANELGNPHFIPGVEITDDISEWIM